jgi:hypothetical protein
MKRYLILICMLVGAYMAAPHASAQKVFKKAQKSAITDPGELYSTYDFNETEIATIKAAMSKPEKTEDVIKWANEAGWPQGISDFSERIKEDKQALMKKLVVFKVVEIDDKWLLWIPMNKNKKSGLTFSHDIYFVISKSGVK